MSCRIQAAEHRKCTAELTGAYPGLQDRILLKDTKIENVHEVRKKTFNFRYVWRSSKLSVFLFPCWDIKFLNASVLNKAVFELVQQFYDATEIGNVAIAVSACADQP